MVRVRIGFIGAGNLANRVHYPSLARLEEAELVAVCDLNPQRLHATAERYGIEPSHRYTDFRQMLRQEEFEAVYIIMPPHHLYDLVIECLRAKKHVFIEKPPGVSLEQTYQMAREAERQGVKSMVGFNRRFIPVVREARRMVEERGPILQAVATFYKHYFAAPYYNGAVDILTSDCIHAVDMLRWMGGEVKRLAAVVERRMMDYHNSFHALMEFESGAVGVLLGNWVAGKRIHTFEMHARGISAFVDPDGVSRIYADDGAFYRELETRQVAGGEEFYQYYGFFQENRHFLRCILEDRTPETHFGDAVKTMELVDRIYHSPLTR